jgi:hypothetical protein
MCTFAYWLAINVLLGVDIPQLRTAMYIIFIPWSIGFGLMEYSIFHTHHKEKNHDSTEG